MDRFVKHDLKVKQYLRYGDDFILIEPDLQKLQTLRIRIIQFLTQTLKLLLNPKTDHILEAGQGLKFLGVMIYPGRRKLTARNLNRIKKRINYKNFSSYYGLVVQHGSHKFIHEFDWLLKSFSDTENE